MDWQVAHDIAAPLAAVEAIILAPGTLDAIVRRQWIVASAREIERREGPGWRMRVADFEPALPHAMLPRIIDPDWIGWRETVRWDTATHRGTFEIHPRLPERFRTRFRCEGRYALEALGPDRTRRTVHGVLAVRAPIIGPAIEGWVTERLQASFAQEAAVLEERA